MHDNGFAGAAFDTGDGGVGDDVDAFVGEELVECFADVGILPVNEGRIALDDGDVGTEAAHGLSQLEADEAAAEDEEMLGEGGDLEEFDVGHGGGVGEARDGVDGGTGAGVEEDVVGAQGAGATGVEGDFDGLFRDEATEAHDDLGFGFRVVGEVRLAEAVDHALAAGAHGFHVDVPVAVDDAELCAALEEGGDLGGVDDVLAGKAGDVGAGSAYTLVFDIGDLLALRAEMPGEVFAAFSAADDDCVVLFGCGHWFSVGE